MNKKGEANVGTTILIILLVVVFISFFIMVLILVNRNVEKEEQLKNSMNLYINNLDNKTKTQIGGKYYLINDNLLIDQGDLSKNSLTEIKGINSKGIELYCKEQGYYLTSKEKNFTEIEINNNASKMTCESNAYGDLKIESNSTINENQGYIKLDLSSKREFHNISGVISWKSGTVWVKYLGDSTEIPNRFKETSDYAFETDISLSNSNATIILEYKAIELRNSEDCITVTLFDQDYYVLNGELFQSSENGENLGNPKDFTKTFCYGI